jgi:hypothetical protein
MRGRKTLRRAGIVLAFGALLSAGMLASGALGMVSIVTGTTDSSSTATDTTPPTDTTPTSTSTTTTTETTTTTTTTTTAPSPFSPSIMSDKGDYNPGATVTLTGAGWGAGELVHINVNDDIGQTWSYNTDATADLSGGFSVQFPLPSSFIATYNVTATGPVSGTATTTFTDASVDISPTTATAIVGQSRTYTATGQNCTLTGYSWSTGGQGNPSGTASPASGTNSTFVVTFTGAGGVRISLDATGTNQNNNACSGSAKVDVSVAADTAAPTGSISINSGDAYTKTGSVNLSLNATDNVGVTAYRVANGSSCATATYQAVTSATPFTQSVAFSLSAGDGVKTVCAQYKDFPGNESVTATDTIILDTQAPTTTASAGGYTFGNWTKNNVTVTLSATDGTGSGVASTHFSVDGGSDQTGVSVALTTDGDHTVSYYSIDNAGNSETAQTVHVKIDKAKPVLAATLTSPPDGAAYVPPAWSKDDVKVAFSCDDVGGSGVDTNSAAGATVGEGADQSVTNTGSCTDKAGNSAAPVTVLHINVDKTAPSITIVTPANGATYMLGSTVNANYTCDPGTGSPITSCSGPVANTTPIITSPASAKAFTVNAADAAGNTASLTYNYNIGNLSFLQPIDGNLINIAKLGRVVPVKANIFRNGTALGQGQGPISMGGAAPIPCSSGSGTDDIEVYAAGNSNTANQFRFDGSGFWIYNLDTSSLSVKTGNCYRLDIYYGGTADGNGKVDVSSPLSTAFRIGFFYLEVTK